MVSWIFVHIGSGNGLLLLPNQCWFTVNKTPKNTCQWNHLVGDSMYWFLSWWPIHTIQTPMCCTVLWPSDAIWRYTCRSGVNIDSGIGLLSGGPKLSDGPKPLPDYAAQNYNSIYWVSKILPHLPGPLCWIIIYHNGFLDTAANSLVSRRLKSRRPSRLSSLSTVSTLWEIGIYHVWDPNSVITLDADVITSTDTALTGK